MTRLLIVLGLATLGFTAAPSARACDEYCEEYVEHLEERAEERAYAREEAMEEGEIYVTRRRAMHRQATPPAPKVSAAKRSRRTGSDTDEDEPKTSEASSSKSEVATAGGCKQYFPAVGMALSVPCK